MDDERREFSHQSGRELYSVAAVREIERQAIECGGISGYALMQRAATAAWRAARERWPDAQRIGVVCGSGNNGGDGYEIARLARADGCTVSLFQIGSPAQKGDAVTARQNWHLEATSEPWSSAATTRLAVCDLLIDAIFGIGLSRPPDGEAHAAIDAINAAHAQGCGVLAVDLPSGLIGDTGHAAGIAVEADLTVSFVAHKSGLYTGQAAEFCGQRIVDDLGVRASGRSVSSLGWLQHRDDLRSWLPRRRRDSHKGDHGHLLVIGGDRGTAGALLMCARAALRAGAGLVSVATRAEHAVAMTAAQPELMCHAIATADDLQSLLDRADAIAIGPGLGQSEWGRALWSVVAESDLPCVVDADALNLLAEHPRRRPDWVLTPHPGEAGRLLGKTTADVQVDRLATARDLQCRYGGVAVLKGSGTLIQGQSLSICPYGNPGMGVGGMGDVLTGVVGAFLAQGLTLELAANAAVLAHALAGDRVAMHGERGLLPSDLIDQLRSIVNP